MTEPILPDLPGWPVQAPAYWYEDWDGGTPGEDVTAQNSNFSLGTPGHFQFAVPTLEGPGIGAQVGKISLTGGGSMALDVDEGSYDDEIVMDTPIFIASEFANNSAVFQMQTASGTPICQAFVFASTGRILIRDQNTNSPAQTVGGVVPGQWMRLQMGYRFSTTECEIRAYWDYFGDPDNAESITHTLVNNPVRAERFRWGLATAQGSLNGTEMARVSLWDEWPVSGLPPRLKPPIQVRQGGAWVPYTGIQAKKQGVWKDPLAYRIRQGDAWAEWDGQAWTPM